MAEERNPRQILGARPIGKKEEDAQGKYGRM
jgi:hypothetical protein